MWKVFCINIKDDKIFPTILNIQITTEMIYYKFENSDEKIRISSFKELCEKDFWNNIVYLDRSYNEITNLNNYHRIYKN
jgi:hypothetical protein